jgi:fructokinase
MTTSIWVLGESLMDCIAQPDGLLKPLMGGSPFNMARAAALRGARVGYLNPLSTDVYGVQMRARLEADSVAVLAEPSALPTSLAVVQVNNGQPSYGFYREGIADRGYTVDGVLTQLRAQAQPGVLHTGSLMLIPPEHEKVLAVLDGARALGWTISVDVNLRTKVAPDLPAYLDAVRAVADRAHWLKASDEDLEWLGFEKPTLAQAPELAQHWLGRGVQRLALTFGGDGAFLQVGHVSAQSPVPQVTVVDTVGAGDTFWGNTVADWVLAPEGAEARCADTLRLAMKAAAINCSREGCQPPRRDEL